jgi:hypothetical protein
MSDQAPGSGAPDIGLTPDVGLSLHEWATRWQQIEDDRADDPGESLEEAADLLDDVLAELHVPATGAEAAGTEDLVAARRQIADVLQRQPVARDEVADAFDEARRVVAYLLSGRAERDETGF